MGIASLGDPEPGLETALHLATRQKDAPPTAQAFESDICPQSNYDPISAPAGMRLA